MLDQYHIQQLHHFIYPLEIHCLICFSVQMIFRYQAVYSYDLYGITIHFSAVQSLSPPATIVPLLKEKALLILDFFDKPSTCCIARKRVAPLGKSEVLDSRYRYQRPRQERGLRCHIARTQDLVLYISSQDAWPKNRGHRECHWFSAVRVSTSADQKHCL